LMAESATKPAPSVVSRLNAGSRELMIRAAKPHRG
jgi:hypothetical protein